MMDKVIVSDVVSLYDECKGNAIAIYGAKTVAQRACLYLENKGLEVDLFLVSKKYDNPEILMNKSVEKIEDNKNKAWDCVVLAVSSKYVLDAGKELEKYNIKKLVIISPLMDDDFPFNSCGGNIEISANSFLSLKTQIFADETSKIIIDDGVVIKDNVRITSTNNSIIHICKSAYIGNETVIGADENSKIEVKENVDIGKQSEINAVSNSKIACGDENIIGHNSIMFARESDISIGLHTTVGPYLYITCHKTKIEIGVDNMFSTNVRLCSGNHRVIDKKSGKDITNREKIRTGNHVWIGAGATLLAGSDIMENSIVGAAAVVTKRMEPFSACAGNPAKVIKRDIDWKR
ncbi:transferase hexapeptide (six repeat-containing protein) [Lachnospiraceae bacterium A10]|nr:transferase hexapeptide (six repeat-containing protein) [Lachnospiraceae bacterium A10]